MPQLNPEFFLSQVFWLVITFSFLLIFLWKITLPRISFVLEKIEKVVESITGLPSSHQEQLQVLRYFPGQEYKVHHDFFHEGSDYYERVIKEGGQRLYSIMFYLNTVTKGGETHFPKLDNLKVSAIKGRALLFKNTIDGIPLYESLHAGLAPVDDTKWIAVKWVRESICESNYPPK